MSTQHTSKTWTCVQNGLFLPMDGWSVAHEDFTIQAAAPIKAGGKVIAIVVDGRNCLDLELAEMKANAHLIAAAPDMYDALKSMRAYLSKCPPHSEDIAGAEWGRVMDVSGAALARAEGKS